jgi:hypothetical protein
VAVARAARCGASMDLRANCGAHHFPATSRVFTPAQIEVSAGMIHDVFLYTQ